MDANIIASRLRSLRGSRSRIDTAQRLGISTSALSMYERGERIPRDEVKIRFANLYQKSVQEIFYD